MRPSAPAMCCGSPHALSCTAPPGASTAPSGNGTPATAPRACPRASCALARSVGSISRCRPPPPPGRPRCSLAKPALHPRPSAAPTAISVCFTCSASQACTSGSGAFCCGGSCRAPCAAGAGPCCCSSARWPSSPLRSRARPWRSACAMPARHAADPSHPGVSGPLPSSSRSLEPPPPHSASFSPTPQRRGCCSVARCPHGARGRASCCLPALQPCAPLPSCTLIKPRSSPGAFR